MKIFIMILIVITFGIVGYYKKLKYKNQSEVLLYIKDFVLFYKCNLSINKDDLSKIINNYKIKQNIKNAKYNIIFLNNDKNIKINCEKLKEFIFDNNKFETINLYFEKMGNCIFNLEKENCNELEFVLDKCIDESKEELKVKGELQFKLWLIVGIVVAVLMW